MSFRSVPTPPTALFATPTASVDIGDAAVAGPGPFSASSQHQHAVPAPAPGYATYIAGAPADGGGTTPALATHTHGHTAAHHQAGGFADLSGYFSARPAGADGWQYVSAAGNNANDGLTPGSAKATIAAALLTLPAGGGVIIVGAGVFVVSAPMGLTHVRLQGSGIDVTTLRLDATAWAAFGSSFILQPPGDVPANSTDVVVSDLTLDGNRRAGGGGANQGGLLATGNRWTVERVRFYDSNFFKLWILNSQTVRVRGCRFETTGSGNDNIGGGGTNTDIEITGCYWAADITGNLIDFTNGSDYRIHHNRSDAVKSLILEGVTDSEISYNQLKAKIWVRSDSGYGHATLTQPRDIRIVGNEVDTPPDLGIHVVYDDDAGATTKVPGGGVLVALNTVRNPVKIGILVDGANDALVTSGDTVCLNKVINANTDGSNTFNTGIAVYENAGIAVGPAAGSVVEGNTVVDNQGVPTTRWAVAITANAQTSTTRDITVRNNTGRGMTLGELTVPNPSRLAGNYRVGNSGIISDSHALTTVVNTVADSALVTFAIPTYVAPGDVLKLVVEGDTLNNSAGNVTQILRAKIGATTAITSNTMTLINTVNRRQWRMEVEILVVATNDQRVSTRYENTPSTPAGTNLSTGTENAGVGYGTAAEDLTAGKNLVVSVQMGTADPNADVRVQVARLEVLKRG